MTSFVYWFLCLFALLAVFLVRMRFVGPRAALGTVTLASLLVPVWLLWDVGGQPVNVRVVMTLLALGVYDIHPKSTFRTTLTCADFALLALIAVHILSDWKNDGVGGMVPLRAYCEWALPYLAGRLALQCVDDVRRLLPVAIIVGGIFSALSVTEAVTHVNPVEWVFGDRPVELSPRDLSRWGMKRAFGPTMHSIFFGILQLLMFPWAIYAARRSQRHAGPRWWTALPLLSAAGIVCTGSRGPVLGVAILGFAVLFALFEKQRKLMGAIAGVVVVGLALGAPYLIRVIETWGEEAPVEKRNVVHIDGEKVRVSSAMGRVYLFDVYGLAMEKAGWLGWGTTRTTGFPVNVPIGLKHVENQKRIPWVDDEYILMILRFGYLGCIFFTLYGAAVVLNYYLLARDPASQGSLFFGAMGGAVLATILLLLTVWMPYDFGFLLLWCGGASSGLRSSVPDPFAAQEPPGGTLPSAAPETPERHRRHRHRSRH